MQRFLVFFLVLLCVSCDFFESKTANNTQELVEKQMQEIDWNAVDKFPMFQGCDELAPKPEQRKCFEQTFSKHYAEILGEFEFILGRNIQDTIDVDFIVDYKGEISVKKIEKNAAIANKIPEFNGIIARGLKSLPKVEPALKRGIPVSAKFRLPIIINTK